MHTNIQYEQPLTWTLQRRRNLPASVLPESPVHLRNTSRDLRTCRKSHRHYGNNRHLFLAKHCMKIKGIGPRGGRP